MNHTVLGKKMGLQVFNFQERFFIGPCHGSTPSCELVGLIIAKISTYGAGIAKDGAP
jgi:hypothetical protein